MKLIDAADYAELSRAAAGIVVEQVRKRPDSLLVLPTGNTPVGMFRDLVAAAHNGDVDFSRARFAMLDEYAGIGRNDERRLYHWIRKELFDPLGVRPGAVIAFDPEADPECEARFVEQRIARQGGIDLAVLGLGPNGHIAMNEPGSDADSRTRLVTLTPATIRSNAAYWGSEAKVPRKGLTLGLGTLAEARALVLLVAGGGKAAILERVLNAAPSDAIPAAILGAHPAFTVVADRAALGLHA
ncbi:6-phosphogluconolactonase [Rhodobium gokarnense]|uniref:Glucosamine-6-phosphate deaminase n=1 Tax=Rhodobium gokarnense TaxID=364296 RepID=A0ABT3HF03_9HYPH|nr:glucosamine-6-phosphate deaminase [Rhodobium gokarnense]MCW2308979.1 glucosamine-6-phosphate deaminase [Rhodobium gokarnense]